MSQLRVVPVQLGGHQYQISVQPGLLDQVGETLRPLVNGNKAIVISDTNVQPQLGDRVVGSLGRHGIEARVVVLPAGEGSKSIAHLSEIYDRVLSFRIDRGTPVLALGGGVVGDIGGFAAATLLRGLPFIQVPTTLLAMVDASVGGKTGINHAVGKNLIGSFHQPLAVLIDPSALRTLPERELRGGLAECIKHDIIRDAEGFDRLERQIGRALSGDIDYLCDLVAHNVAIKARVVEADPFERGERAHLNFGHTFGHAIETVSNYSYSHGESVALGMVAASRLAMKIKMLDADSCRRIVRLIGSAKLPTGGMSLDPAVVSEAMHFDKKAKSGRIRFILPDRIGHVVVRDDIDPSAALEAIESLRS